MEGRGQRRIGRVIFMIRLMGLSNCLNYIHSDKTKIKRLKPENVRVNSHLQYKEEEMKVSWPKREKNI